jgi:hypothetical protein
MNAMIGNSLLLNSAGYQISRSVRLRSSATAYFNRNAYPVSGAGTKWTMSKWLKRGTIGVQTDLFTFVSTTGAAQQAGIQFDSNNAIRWWQFASGTYQFHKVTTAVFRDPSAWYHIVFVYDTTLATATDRCQIWINGVRQTSFSTSTDPSLNLVTYYNTGTLYPYLGAENRNASSALAPFDGYLTEVNFIDGQALTPSSFGQTDATTGVWSPIKYTGTYGTNGFYLNFSNPSAATAAAIGADYSGNGNNWTPNNISVTAGATYDSMLDVPTQFADGGNGRGNYCVLNPLRSPGGNGAITQGNLYVVTLSGDGHYSGTIAMTSGKWYAEFTPTFLGAAGLVGLVDISKVAPTAYPNSTAFGWIYISTGNKINNNVSVAYGATWTTNDVIGIAYDADAGTVTFYKNGASQGQAYSGITGDIAFCCYDAASANYAEFAANFGQRPFSYTPPTGFRALNTLNLPTPTILKGNQFFDATLFTSTGTTQVVTNSGFRPDWLWFKRRNAAQDHFLFTDPISLDQYLSSNTTAAEATSTTFLDTVNADGFTMGTGNFASTSPVVCWNWKEGATQGFDIVTFTGSTGSYSVNHSLGVAPKMIIYKDRVAAAGWVVMHSSLANMTAAYLLLNSTAAVANLGTTVPAPTSTTFGCSATITNNGDATLAYLFSEVAGFSKFGSYTGNGSADGPFVFCGFRPRWIMVKNISATGEWYLHDTARDVGNLAQNRLFPNLSAAESPSTTNGSLDILSNGFKVRTPGTDNNNVNGNTYIYAAFAENPFKNALAR